MSDAAVYADLHAHTQCSDGHLAPEALVAQAAEQGLQAFAVTDHDTVAGLPAAREAAAARGVRLVSGVELSVAVDGRGVHLLGYGFDPEHPALTDYLTAFTTRRRERLRQMVRRLADHGVDVSSDTVKQHVGTSAAPGRPHLARALAAEGHVEGYRDAFEQYLGTDQPAYVPAPTRPAEEAIVTLHAAGGVAVLAHPGQWMPSPVLRTLREHGLDGIECIFPSHPDYLVEYYQNICRSHDLLVTGGSDYHGRERSNDEKSFGEVGLSQKDWNALSWI